MSVVWILRAGLCLMLHGIGITGAEPNAVEVAADPNVVDRTRALRQLLREEQIQTLTVNDNRTADELPVLDVLIEELSVLGAAVAAAPELIADESDTKETATLTPDVPEEDKPAAAEPNIVTAVAVVEEPKPVPVEAPAPEPDAEPKADMLLEKIKTVDTVERPMGMANALYRSGRTKAAERFYRMAMDQPLRPEDPDYQWALYQNAVCRVSEDPAGARQMFELLIKNCPASPWTAAAQARLKTLKWEEELKTKSFEWMARDPNSL